MNMMLKLTVGLVGLALTVALVIFLATVLSAVQHAGSQLQHISTAPASQVQQAISQLNAQAACYQAHGIGDPACNKP